MFGSIVKQRPNTQSGGSVNGTMDQNPMAMEIVSSKTAGKNQMGNGDGINLAGQTTLALATVGQAGKSTHCVKQDQLMSQRVPGQIVM